VASFVGILPVLAGRQMFIIYMFNCTTDWRIKHGNDDIKMMMMMLLLLLLLLMMMMMI